MEVAGVQVVLRGGGNVRTVDYRGVEVLSAAFPVPGSSWYVMSKKDAAEAFADWRFTSLLMLSLLVALAMLLVLSSVMARQRERTAHLQALYQSEAAAARLGRLYAMLSETNQLIVRGVSRDALIDGVCEIAIRHAGFRCAGFAEADHTGEVRVRAQAGADAAFKSDPYGHQAVRQALDAGGAVVLPVAPPQGDPEVEGAGAACCTGAVAAVPVLHLGEIVGALVFFTDTPEHFGEQELATLQEMAQDVSFALDNFSREEERQRAIEEMQVAIGRLRQFVDANIIGVVIATASGKIVEANDYYLNLIGFTREELRQGLVDWRQLTPPEWSTADEKALAELRTRGACAPYEKEYLRRDGTRVPVLLVDALLKGTVEHIAAFVLDLSELKRAEMALRDNEERLRLAMNAANQGFYDLDLRTGTVIVSPEYARMLEYDPEDFQESIPAWKERLHPEDREAICRVFEEYIAGQREDFRVEFRLRTKSGGWKWILSVGKIVAWDPDGRPLRMLGTHTDIGLLKKAHEKLVLQSTALNAAANAVVLTDIDGNIVWTNPAFSQMTQYSPEECIGRNPRDLVKSGQQDQAFYQAMWDTILAGEVWQGRLVNRQKDGSLYTEEQTITPVRLGHGEITYFVAIKQDISERIQAEHALRRAQEQLQRAVSAGDVGIWDWDLQTNVVEYSAEWMLHAGGERHAATGTIHDWFARVHPDDLGPLRRVLSPQRAGEEPARQAEFRFQQQHGVYCWILMSASFIFDEAGQPLHLVGANIDITRIKKLEQEIAHVQRIDSIGSLAGGIAHDFNNLLSVIVGYADFACDALPEEHPVRQDIQQITMAGGRAVSLTRQLLAFSRRQVLEPKVLSINKVLADLEKMLHRLVREDILLVSRMAPDLGEVMADPGQIEQVIMNLVVNARDAMPDGGQLPLETFNLDVDEAFARQHPGTELGPHVCLSVSDTGIGMDSATMDRIFEPFYTTKPMGQGTGLGLATVYGIVKQSGGNLWVVSEPGRGSTFVICLPRIDTQDRSDAQQEPAKFLAAGSETILLVEDEPAVLDITRRMLLQAGYTVLAARDAGEALDVVRDFDEAIDLLLTDVIMPGASGRNLASELLIQRPGLKVLYMSGYTDTTISHHGVLEAGMHLLIKPFSGSQLTQKIREVLNLPSA